MGFNVAFKALNFGGQYVVVWCILSATQVASIHQRIQSSVLECLLCWFLKLIRVIDQILIVYIGTAAVIGDQYNKTDTRR